MLISTLNTETSGHLFVLSNHSHRYLSPIIISDQDWHSNTSSHVRTDLDELSIENL